MFSSFQSFVIGMGSIFDINGSYFLMSFGKESDSQKLRGDWGVVGNDIKNSYSSKLETFKK